MRGILDAAGRFLIMLNGKQCRCHAQFEWSTNSAICEAVQAMLHATPKCFASHFCISSRNLTP